MLARPPCEADRTLLPIRIMVDLFGPIVDIATLEPFRSVERARYLSASELADELDRRRRKVQLWGRWTERKVLDRVRQALRRWERRKGLIDLEVLKLLLEAEQYGAEIVVVSTVPDAELFDLARNVIRDAVETSFPGGTGNEFSFGHACPRTAGQDWNDILRSLSQAEERYTYVLHDHSALDVGVDEQLFDEWVPRSSKPDGLLSIIHSALERAEQRAPLPWLTDQSDLVLSNFRALGQFLIFDERLRRRLRQQIDNIRRLVERRVVPVLLSGGPGSGKSFFVEQYGDEYHAGCECAKINLAPANDVRASIQAHIDDIVAKRATVAFIDEVDTFVGNGFAFRFLMAAIEGELLDSSGRPHDTLHPFTWFMAGSAGRNRDDMAAALGEQDKKVRDFLSRLDEIIELPGIRSPFEAMLQAASRLKREMRNLREIEKRVLLFFAIGRWKDAREVARVAELVGTQFRDRQSVSLAMVGSILASEELARALETAAAQALDGFVRIS